MKKTTLATAVESTIKDHVMVDLETTSTSGGAGVLAIGAVFFDPMTGEIGSEFYQTIGLESIMKRDCFKVDARCIKWWMTGKDVSQAARNEAFGGEMPINKALLAFQKWI